MSLTGSHSPLELAEVIQILSDPPLAKTPQFKYRCFPVVSQRIAFEDMRVPVRVMNCINALRSESLIDGPHDLSQLSIGKMMKRPNFGLTSLTHLLAAMVPYIGVEMAELPFHVKESISSSQMVLAEAFISKEEHCSPENDTLTWDDIGDLLGKPALLSVPRIRGKKLPEIVGNLTPDDLEISVRTYNCLQMMLRWGQIQNLGDLRKFSIEELLARKNFGRLSMLDLLRAIQPLIVSKVSRSYSDTHSVRSRLTKQLTFAIQKLAEHRTSKKVRCSDLRLKSSIGKLLVVAHSCNPGVPISRSSTLFDLALALAERQHDPLDVEEVLGVVRELNKSIAKMFKPRLEEELMQLAGCVTHGRNLQILKSFYGFSGCPPKTLQAVGDQIGLTRERVRQILVKTTRGLKVAKNFTPRLDRAIAILTAKAPCSAEFGEEVLKSLGLTEVRFSAEAIISAAKLFNRPVPFKIDTSAGARTLLRVADAALNRLTLSRARRLVSHYGLCSYADLSAVCSEATRSQITEESARAIVSKEEAFSDLGEGWFWFRSHARNHLVTLLRKLFSVAPQLHVSEVRASVAADPRGFGFSPPRRVMIRFCEDSLGCRANEDDTLIASGLSPDQELSDSEKIIFRVLQERGPLLHRYELERLSVAKGINPITFNLYLGRRPIIAKYASSVYGLRGATFTADQLEKARPTKIPTGTDHGWDSQGRTWIACSLTNAALSTGILAIPVGLRESLAGSYLIRTSDGELMGTLVVSPAGVWSLSSFFRRRGGEPGDILLLTFDKARRSVEVLVGNDEIIPENEISIRELPT